MHVLGVENKRQIIVAISSATNGSSLPTICGKNFNSLLQKWGTRIELVTKSKYGMANRLLVNSQEHGVHTKDQVTTSTRLFNVYTCKLYTPKLQTADVIM